MITSIDNLLPVLPLRSAMSGGEQVRETAKAPHSESEPLLIKTKTPSTNRQGESTHDVQYTEGITPTGLNFRIDKDTDQVVITVLRRDTEEVIREIPLNKAFSVSSTLDVIQLGHVFHAVT